MYESFSAICWRILASFTDDTISIASTLSNHSHDQHHQETISSIWKNMKSLNRDKRATQTLIADVWMTSLGSFEFAPCFVLGSSANWIKMNIYSSDFFYFFLTKINTNCIDRMARKKSSKLISTDSWIYVNSLLRLRRVIIILPNLLSTKCSILKEYFNTEPLASDNPWNFPLFIETKCIINHFLGFVLIDYFLCCCHWFWQFSLLWFGGFNFLYIV